MINSSQKFLNDSDLHKLSVLKFEGMNDKIIQSVANFQSRYSKERLQFLLKLFEAGRSISEIADEFDVSFQQVYNWRNKFTIQVFKPTKLIENFIKIDDEYLFECNRNTIRRDIIWSENDNNHK